MKGKKQDDENQIDEEQLEVLVRQLISTHNQDLISEMVRREVIKEVTKAKVEINRETVVEIETLENLQ